MKLKLTTITLLITLSSLFAQTWTSLNNIPIDVDGKEFHLSDETRFVEINNTAYTFYIGNIFSYNANLDQWSLVSSDFPGEFRYGSYLFALDQKIYVCGGLPYDMPGSEPRNINWEYNLDTNIWTQKSNLPVNNSLLTTYSLAIFTYNNEAYLLDYVLKNFYKYNATNDTWLALSSFPPTGITVVKKPFFIKGSKFYTTFQRFSEDQNSPEEMWEYNIELDSWNRLNDVPIVFKDGGYIRLLNDFGYAGFGNESGTILNTFYKYNFADDIWIQLESAPFTAWQPVSFTINNKAYFNQGIFNQISFWSYEILETTINAPDVFVGENIVVNFNDAPGLPIEWVGVYDTSDVLLDWFYTNGTKVYDSTTNVVNGSITFDSLPQGTYFCKINDTGIIATNTFAVLVSDSRTLIPDQNFEQALIDLNLDDVISGDVLTANIQNVLDLDVLGKNISDLSGIEDFINLETLEVSLNNIEIIRLLNNVNLKHLYSMFNASTTQILINNSPDLEEILCVGCNLTALNISNNNALERLWIGGSSVSELDLSNKVYMKELIVNGGNIITTIDLSNMTLLERAELDGNPISEINTTNNPLLVYLSVSGTNINSIDVSNNINLETLNVASTAMTDVNVTNLSNLELLILDYSSITNIDLDSNSNLLQFFMRETQITEVNLSNLPLLYEFNGTNNPNLTCIQVADVVAANNGTGNYALWYLSGSPNAYYSENCSLDLADNEIDNLITVSPNPTSNNFKIFNLSDDEIINVEIYNYLGKQIFKTTQEIVDVSNLTNGIYLLKIKTKNGLTVSKSIIKK